MSVITRVDENIMYIYNIHEEHCSVRCSSCDSSYHAYHILIRIWANTAYINIDVFERRLLEATGKGARQQFSKHLGNHNVMNHRDVMDRFNRTINSYYHT